MPTSTASLVWGSYVRISDDPNDLGKGVNRQTEDTSMAVARRGGEVSKTYRENDTSAYKKRRVRRRDESGNEYHVFRVIRPVWQQALADLRGGVIDALMVWDFDRLARDPRDLEDAIEVVEYFGKRIEDAAGQIDLMTDGGRMMARMLVAHANKSSADTGRRVARAHLEMARNGQSVGGRRTFGWNDDRMTLNPVEAPLVRRAIADLIVGDVTLYGISKGWNDAGVRTAMGKCWTHTKVRQLLTNPRLAGKRVHLGIEYDGAWESMVDAETWEKLSAIFLTNQSTKKGQRPGARKYMLSGIVRCGTCGDAMTGNKFKETHNYACRGHSTGGDHTMAVAGAHVDRLITEAVLGAMSDAIIATPEQSFDGEDRLAEIQAEKADALAGMREKRISAASAMAMVEILEGEEVELVAERATWLRRTSGPSASRVTPESFAAMDVESRRDIVATWIKYVVVQAPATRRSRSFDPERLEIVWQE